jgi:hypothetical protein
MLTAHMRLHAAAAAPALIYASSIASASIYLLLYIVNNAFSLSIHHMSMRGDYVVLIE